MHGTGTRACAVGAVRVGVKPHGKLERRHIARRLGEQPVQSITPLIFSSTGEVSTVLIVGGWPRKECDGAAKHDAKHDASKSNEMQMLRNSGPHESL